MRKPNTIKMRSLDEIINLVKNKILHLTDPTIFFFELEGEFNLNSRDYKDVLTYLTELKYLQETKKKELATEKENKKIERKKKLKKFFYLTVAVFLAGFIFAMGMQTGLILFVKILNY